MSLSGRTRGALIEVTADVYTHDELDVLFLRLGLEDDYQLNKVEGRTKLRRVHRAVELLEADGRTVDGRLEASNGQLRSALEGFLLELCHRVTGQYAADPKGAVERLRQRGALDGDEARLLTGLVGISNARGAHQGITDREEALFRLHLTSAAARYLLDRLGE
jgi:hypothetical protein